MHFTGYDSGILPKHSQGIAFLNFRVRNIVNSYTVAVVYLNSLYF